MSPCGSQCVGAFSTFGGEIMTTQDCSPSRICSWCIDKSCRLDQSHNIGSEPGDLLQKAILEEYQRVRRFKTAGQPQVPAHLPGARSRVPELTGAHSGPSMFEVRSPLSRPALPKTHECHSPCAVRPKISDRCESQTFLDLRPGSSKIGQASTSSQKGEQSSHCSSKTWSVCRNPPRKNLPSPSARLPSVRFFWS